jgi:hypothetical protein
LASRQINIKSTRVVLEENEFVTVKFVELGMMLQDIPAFKFLNENLVLNPVLRAGVEFGQGGVPMNTLITTPEEVHNVIPALWKRHMSQTDEMPTYLSQFSVSLRFMVRASVRYETLKNLSPKPWELLHGIRTLSLAGNTRDVTQHHLQRSMAKGPLPTGVAATLTEYHSMRQQELMQRNYSAPRRWWNQYDDYCRHLINVRVDPFGEGSLSKEANDNLWVPLWNY